jgi:predicted dehydrogenase
LVSCGITFRIAFTLAATHWFLKLKELISSVGDSFTEIKIEWSFRAHHYSNGVDTWKRYTPQGGGALRYYCIHFLGLLATMGEWTPLKCERHARTNGEEPYCSFVVRRQNVQVSILCDTISPDSPRFLVTSSAGGQHAEIVSLDEPFSEHRECYDHDSGFRPPIGGDRRINALESVLDGLFGESSKTNLAYLRHAKLWQALEMLALNAP